MNIPTLSGHGPTAATDYQSLYAAPSSKTTFAQVIAETQSSWLSLTTAEGDRVTLSDLSMSYQQTQGVGLVTPTASGTSVSSSSTSAESMGLSVQGDLNAQELADITRLVTELTSIASTFYAGDYEGALSKAIDFGDLGLGSVSSLAASFSRQTVTQTKISSYSSLPSMANLKDLYEKLEKGTTAEPDYAALLEARWQQILKTLDQIQAETLDGVFARREESQGLETAPVAPPSPEKQRPPAIEASPVRRENEPSAPPPPASPARAQGPRQMLARLEQLFNDHPKLAPFAKNLAATVMENGAGRTTDHAPADLA
ncbi:MAG: hypothetical protein A2512_01445 [Deltaproteobacteria bacterium RIFOXYD12_FULL_56_24]|nr:MAG: hypothetical protein A2512_01445 [Deltaproteobacteria bacterium RIFOXYD12_FULL_56_24]